MFGPFGTIRDLQMLISSCGKQPNSIKRLLSQFKDENSGLAEERADRKRQRTRDEQRAVAHDAREDAHDDRERVRDAECKAWRPEDSQVAAHRWETEMRLRSKEVDLKAQQTAYNLAQDW